MNTVANTEQAEHWNSEESAHWVDHDARYNRILRPFGERVVATADVQPGQHVLDIGCGCGDTTRAAAARARPGDALGLDLSGPMLGQAQRLAQEEGLDNVRFEQGDAQVHQLDAARFDLAISRFGVMFFADAVAAFANVRSALRPGGRLVFACWRSLLENEYITVPATAALEHVPMPDLGDDPTAPGPFSLADPDRIRAVLTDAGYSDVEIEPVDERTVYGTDAADTLAFMQDTTIWDEFFGSAPPDAAARAAQAVEEALAAHQTAEGVVLGSAAWLVQAQA